jgi:hypothetical protein
MLIPGERTGAGQAWWSRPNRHPRYDETPARALSPNYGQGSVGGDEGPDRAREGASWAGPLESLRPYVVVILPSHSPPAGTDAC